MTEPTRRSPGSNDLPPEVKKIVKAEVQKVKAIAEQRFQEKVAKYQEEIDELKERIAKLTPPQSRGSSPQPASALESTMTVQEAHELWNDVIKQTRTYYESIIAEMKSAATQPAIPSTPPPPARASQQTPPPSIGAKTAPPPPLMMGGPPPPPMPPLMGGPPPPPPPPGMMAPPKPVELHKKYADAGPLLEADEKWSGSYEKLAIAAYNGVKKHEKQVSSSKELSEGIQATIKDLGDATMMVKRQRAIYLEAHQAAKEGRSYTIETNDGKVDRTLFFADKESEEMPAGAFFAGPVDKFAKQIKELAKEGLKELQEESSKLVFQVEKLSKEMKEYQSAASESKRDIESFLAASQTLAENAKKLNSEESLDHFYKEAFSLNAEAVKIRGHQQGYERLVLAKKAFLFKLRSEAGLMEKDGKLIKKQESVATKGGKAKPEKSFDPAMAAILRNPARFVSQNIKK